MDRELLNLTNNEDLESILCAALDKFEGDRRDGSGETKSTAIKRIKLVNDLLGESSCKSDWVYLATSVAATNEAKAEVMTEILACYTAGMEVEAGRRDQTDNWTPCESVPENFFDYVFRVR